MARNARACASSSLVRTAERRFDHPVRSPFLFLRRTPCVSRNTINSIESGKYVPSTVLALKIARHFGKPVDTIFRLDEND